MALIVKDRVRETSTTSGTGTINLGGALTGFQSFGAIGDGNTTYYTIVDATTGDWEVGIGTYTAGGTPTLSRDTVLESSNLDNKVNFAANTKDVFCVYTADRAVSQADVGTDPNQVPLNQYLGSLAYQNIESVVIEGGEVDLQGGGSNLLAYSQEMTSQDTGRVTVTSNATTAPDGTTTADQVTQATGQTNGGYVGDITFSYQTGDYVFSVFAKNVDADWIRLQANSASSAKTAWFNLSTGAVGTENSATATITDVGDGWYRCSMLVNDPYQFAAAFLADGDNATTATPGESVYFWGAQLEQSSTVGTYVPTTTTAITLDQVAEATQLFIPTSSGVTGEQRILAFELASDTSLVVKVQGSDGAIRSATLTLS